MDPDEVRLEGSGLAYELLGKFAWKTKTSFTHGHTLEDLRSSAIMKQRYKPHWQRTGYEPEPEPWFVSNDEAVAFGPSKRAKMGTKQQHFSASAENVSPSTACEEGSWLPQPLERTRREMPPYKPKASTPSSSSTGAPSTPARGHSYLSSSVGTGALIDTDASDSSDELEVHDNRHDAPVDYDFDFTTRRNMTATTRNTRQSLLPRQRVQDNHRQRLRQRFSDKTGSSSNSASFNVTDICGTRSSKRKLDTVRENKEETHFPTPPLSSSFSIFVLPNGGRRRNKEEKNLRAGKKKSSREAEEQRTRSEEKGDKAEGGSMPGAFRNARHGASSSTSPPDPHLSTPLPEQPFSREKLIMAPCRQPSSDEAAGGDDMRREIFPSWTRYVDERIVADDDEEEEPEEAAYPALRTTRLGDPQVVPNGSPDASTCTLKPWSSLANLAHRWLSCSCSTSNDKKRGLRN